MTAARIGGGIAALVLLLGLVVVGFQTAGNEPVVKPEVNVTAKGATDATGGLQTSNLLKERSRLMGDRAEPGQIGGTTVEEGTGFGKGALTFKQGVENPDRTMRDWGGVTSVDGILRDPGEVQGVSSLPYKNADVLERPAARDWRRSRNGEVSLGGGWLILGFSIALALFLFGRGRIKIAEGPAQGPGILRFSRFERANHWMTAVSFILLALTGLLLIYGKPLVMPLIGKAAYGNVALGAVWLHMASIVPFGIGLLAMIVLWLDQNIPTATDWHWLRQGGGFLTDDGDNPPARRFNAGQKIVFWGVVLGGLAAFATGIVLMFPFYWFGYQGMQWTQLLHAAIGLLMTVLIIGHIYIGTVGMEGAIDAMWSGRVDRNWAKEHHSLWYRDVAGAEDAPRRLRNNSSKASGQQAAE